MEAQSAEKIPFHQHLDECEQCRNNPMKLCEVGHELLLNRTYDMPEKPVPPIALRVRRLNQKTKWNPEILIR